MKKKRRNKFYSAGRLMLRRFTDYCVYLVVRVLFCFVQSISLPMSHKIARQMAVLFTDMLPVRRQLLHKNLQIAFPELTDEDRRRLILAMWEHLFTMGAEIALANRKIRDKNWQEHFTLCGAEPLLECLNSGRPVILVTGHFGNFEIGGFALGVLTYPSHSVARTLDNPYLDKFIRNFRESTGQFLIGKKGATDNIVRVLSSNGLLAFLADQSAGKKGCRVNFFGTPASTFKAIAVSSLQFNAPIAVCYALRKQDASGNFLPMHFDIHINGVLDPAGLPPEIQNVKDITQWFTAKLEEGIRQEPEQYWWLHNRWKK